MENEAKQGQRDQVCSTAEQVNHYGHPEIRSNHLETKYQKAKWHVEQSLQVKQKWNDGAYACLYVGSKTLLAMPSIGETYGRAMRLIDETCDLATVQVENSQTQCFPVEPYGGFPPKMLVAAGRTSDRDDAAKMLAEREEVEYLLHLQSLHQVQPASPPSKS